MFWMISDVLVMMVVRVTLENSVMTLEIITREHIRI